MQMNEDSEDGDAMDSDTEHSTGTEFEQPATGTHTAHEAASPQEMTQKTLLDTIFGELPPKALIKTKLLFPKPPHPLQRPQKKHPLFLTKACMAAEETSHEATKDVMRQEETQDFLKKCFVRIGGMLVMPVPVKGPLFANEELDNGRFELYEKYIPEIECYNSVQKPLPKLSFPLDFPKPVRPGTKMRSRPSVLKQYGKPSPITFGGPIPLFMESRVSRQPKETDTSKQENVPEKLSCCDKIKAKLPCFKKKKAPESDGSIASKGEAPSRETSEVQPEVKHHSHIQSPKVKAKKSFPEPREISISEQSVASASSEPKEKLSCWDKIKTKCPCCKKKEAPEVASPSGESLPVEPPKEPPSFISETHKVTTFPPSLQTTAPETKSKQHIRVKKSTKLNPPPEVTIPVSVHSIFNESKQPPKPCVSEVCAQEPSKLPKGILKSSEERMQPGKSVSISLPEKTDDNELSPDFIPHPSTTHFRSQEMSSVTMDGQFQQASERRVPTSPANKIHKEVASAPTVSLTYQKHTPMFARISTPPLNVPMKDSKEVKEESPETGSPELFTIHPTGQDISPVTNTTTLQTSPEKAVPSLPVGDASTLSASASQFHQEVASVPIASLKSQRRGRLFARASAPPRKTAEKIFREGKEEAKSATVVASSPEPSAPQATSPTAPQEASPTALQETSPTAPQETLPTAPQEMSPTALQETSPPAPQKTLPPTPQETSPPAPQETSPPAPQKTSPTAPQETSPPAPQKTLPTTPQETSPTAGINSVLPYSKEVQHKTPEGNFRRKEPRFDDIYSPVLTKEKRLYDAPIENDGEGTGADRLFPTTSTAASRSRPASRRKRAPLPGANWVQRFI